MRKLLLIVILIVAGVWIWKCTQRREVTVSFAAPAGFRPRDTVVFGDRIIGSVTAVRQTSGGELGGEQVDVQIAPDSKDLIRTDSNFLVRDHPSQAGRKQLVVDNSLATGSAAEQHQMLEASRSTTDLEIAGKRLVKHVGEDLSALGAALVRKLRGEAPDLDSERLRQMLESAGKDLFEWGKEGVAKGEEKLADLEGEARDYEAKLRREGKLEQAGEFKADFKRWMEKARTKIHEATAKSEASPSPATASPR